MTEPTKIPSRHLLNQWQEIVQSSELHKNPALASMLHAMFMTGAGASMLALHNATEETVNEVVEEVCEELNNWAKTMNLAIAPVLGGRQ